MGKNDLIIPEQIAQNEVLFGANIQELPLVKNKVIPQIKRKRRMFRENWVESDASLGRT